MDYDLNDIEIAVKKTAGNFDIYQAAKRLMDVDDEDVRTIAAQSLVGNSVVEVPWIYTTIEKESSSEVRGWLYLALAGVESSPNSLIEFSILKNVKKNKTESLFMLTALAICSHSRYYLLDLMKIIIISSGETRDLAKNMCNMLIEDGNNFDSAFLSSIENDRYVGDIFEIDYDLIR